MAKHTATFTFISYLRRDLSDRGEFTVVVQIFGHKKPNNHKFVRSGTDRAEGSCFITPRMSQSKTANRDQALYQKSMYLRVNSLGLLREAQDLGRTSSEIRKTIARLAYDMRVIRSKRFTRTTDHVSREIREGRQHLMELPPFEKEVSCRDLEFKSTRDLDDAVQATAADRIRLSDPTE